MQRGMFLFTGVFLMAGMAIASSIPITPAKQVKPRGEIVDRMKKAVQALDAATTEDIWNGFSKGMWGGDWPGRTLEAYSRVSLALGGPASTRFDEVGKGLLSHLTEEGKFETIFNGNPHDFSNGFWFGQCRAILGLVWAYHYTNDEEYKNASVKAADYIVAHFFDEGQPGAPSPFWWVATEALGEVQRITQDKKYSEFALKIASTIPPASANFYGLHTHSYLLSLRGCMYAHETLGDLGVLNKVLEQHAVFRDRIMWPGGGIIEHLGGRGWNTLNYWFDEGCSVDDWLGLNLDLWRTTGDAKYMDMVERIHLNHFYFDQDAAGGFCGDRGVDATREGSPWPFCCSMHGTSTLAELTQYIASTDGARVWVNVFLPGTVTLKTSGQEVALDLETKYPADGNLHIAVGGAGKEAFPLYVRVPAWSKVEAYTVNGKAVTPSFDGGYAVVPVRVGDAADITLAMPLRTEVRNRFIGDGPDTDYSLVSLWKGPRQLVYDQTLNNGLWDARTVRPGFREIYDTYGEMTRDQSLNKTPLKIGEKEYKKGLGVRSVSEIAVALNGEFKEFVSDIGVDACTGGKGAVRFKACVDGVVKGGQESKASIGGASDENMVEALYGFQVASMSGTVPAKTIRLDVSGAKSLRLIVDDAVNGLEDDVADWGDARLVKEDGTVVYLSDLPDNRAEGMPSNWGVVTLKPVEPEKDGVVALEYQIDGKTYPVRFHYLADLGHGLIAHRPVLRNYLQVDPNWMNNNVKDPSIHE